MRLIIVAFAFTATAPALAQTATLTDGNSRAGVTARNGMTTWFIDGSRDNVFLSNYYVRFGASGPERPLADALGAPTLTQPTANSLRLDFTNGLVDGRIDWLLTGGTAGSGRSAIAKAVTVTNRGAEDLELSLFDYTDFDIRFDPASQLDQSVALRPGRIETTSARFPIRIVTDVTPSPDAYQISDFLTLYYKFFIDQDGPTMLSSTPVLGEAFPAVPGDTAFAFQWNTVLAPGESFSVAQLSRLVPVPAPGGAVVALIGLAALARRRRTRG